jgi:hypothetical protein
MVRVVVGLLGSATAAAAQSNRSCPAPDSTSSALQRIAVSVASDTTGFARQVRSTHTIPVSTPSQVSLVQDSTVCEHVTAGIESQGTISIPEAPVVIRLGGTSPFYLATKRRDGVMGPIYLLNSDFVLIGVLTSG